MITVSMITGHRLLFFEINLIIFLNYCCYRLSHISIDEEILKKIQNPSSLKDHPGTILRPSYEDIRLLFFEIN